MVSHAGGAPGHRRGLDDDEIQSQRERRNQCPVRKGALRSKRLCGTTEPDAFPGVHRLLGSPEFPGRPGPDLHDHEPGRQREVDGNDVQFGPADADLAAEDPPSGGDEPVRHQLLSCVSDLLRLSPHGQRIAGVNALPIIW